MQKYLLLLAPILFTFYSFAQCPLSTPIINEGDQVVCSPGSYTFTTTAVSNVSFQWKLNGMTLGGETNSSCTVYVSGDYSVEISNGICASVESSPVTFTAVQAPIVTITSDKTSICAGSPVTFTAIPSNAGAAPLYEWFLGEESQGAPSSNQTFTTSLLTPNYSHNSVHAVLTSNHLCSMQSQKVSNTVSISIFNISAGVIGSDQTICYNTAPKAINEVKYGYTSNGPRISIGYKWQASMDEKTWYPLSGIGNYYPVPPLNGTTWIRRLIIDDSAPQECNVAYTDPVKITVLPEVQAGVLTGDETICAGQLPSIISESNPSTDETITYQWQSNDGGAFSNIPSATNVNYSPPALTKTTTFRRLVTSGSCTVPTNVITKTVIPAPSVSLNDPGQSCFNTPLSFIATAVGLGSTPSYQWYVDNTPVGSNSSTFTFGTNIEDNNKQITVKVTSSSDACNTVSMTSTPITLNLINAISPAITIQTDNNPNCSGMLTSFSIKPLGGGATPTYQWFVNTIPVSGATNTTFSIPSLVNGDQVWVEMTSSIQCITGPNPVTSNKIMMLIKPLPTPIINESDATICAGSSKTFTATVGMGTIYRWSNNLVSIPGATNTSFTATLSGNYYIIEDNGVCTVVSDPVTLTIDPCGAFSTSIDGPSPIIPGLQNAVYSVFKQTGFSYEWSVTGGTIISGQNTNAVTVDWDASAVNAVARIATPFYSISVTETNPNNQKKTTTMDVSPVATSISTSLAQSGITLFPNPTTESFSIEMPESGIAVSYEILDLTGASVAKGNFISSSSAEKIAANFGAGMYQVVLRYNGVVTSGRLSKVQ